MMKETGTNSKKFIWRQRIGFGISDYACNLAYLMVNTYLLIFYTDVAGIPAASAAFMFLITKFIDAFTDYMVGALGYRNTNIVFGIMVFLIMLICVASIREINLPPRTNQKTSIIKDIGYLIKNKPYMLMITYTFFLFLGYLGMFAAIAYYFKYIVRNEMMTSVAVTITTIVPIFSMLIAARLNAKYSKRNISIVGTLIQILGSLIIWIGGSNVAIVFLGVGLMGFGMGFRSNMYFSMLADVADYGEWQSGRNLAGTQMAVNGFSNKVSSACASAIVAGLLAWGAYDGTVAVQSSKANMAILFAFVILPIIANIVSIVVMYFYDLDKQYDQMERELKERRKKLAEQTAE